MRVPMRTAVARLGAAKQGRKAPQAQAARVKNNPACWFAPYGFAMSKGGATAPTRPRHGPGRAASRAWPRSTLGASAGTAAREGPYRGGYGGWLLFFSSVPHRPGPAPQTAHGTAQREQPSSLGRNITAASMGTLGGAAPTGAGGLQAPGPIMGPLI